MDPSTARQLSKAIEDFENDDSLRVAVLYGNGGNFCAGFDLKALSEMDASPDAGIHEEGQMVAADHAFL